MKISVKLLSKLMASDNGEVNSIEALAFIHTAEAEKDYAKIFAMLEETRKFIVKLQTELKRIDYELREENRHSIWSI